jgi:hypothetical protein
MVLSVVISFAYFAAVVSALLIRDCYDQQLRSFVSASKKIVHQPSDLAQR